jgi:hypothetical protein
LSTWDDRLNKKETRKGAVAPYRGNDDTEPRKQFVWEVDVARRALNLSNEDDTEHAQIESDRRTRDTPGVSSSLRLEGDHPERRSAA